MSTLAVEVYIPNQPVFTRTFYQEFSVGRETGNDLRIPLPGVSKKHARFQRRGMVWSVKDLKSHNGTRVNGERVDERLLADGDLVDVGEARIVVRLDEQVVTNSTMSVELPRVLNAGCTVERARNLASFTGDNSLEDIRRLKAELTRYQVALELSVALGVEEDLDAILSRVLEFSFRIMRIEIGVGLTVDTQTGTHAVRVIQRTEGRNDPARVSRYIVGEVLRLQEGVVFEDALDQVPSASVVDAGLRSVLAVPVWVNGSIQALLYLDNRSFVACFREDDLLLMDMIAAQAGKAVERGYLLAKIRRETEIQSFMSRFISPMLVESIRAGKDPEALGRQRQPVVTLYSDCRGFSTLCEKAPIEEVEGFLDETFHAMDAVIRRHGGSLDKFIGDALMAIWVAGTDTSSAARKALRCALEMQAEMAIIRAKRLREGRVTLDLGTGVHLGQALVGYVGSGQRRDFTAHGDAVNVAARLSTVAEANQVIVTREMAMAAGAGIRLGPGRTLLLKGRETPVEVWVLEGLAG